MKRSLTAVLIIATLALLSGCNDPPPPPAPPPPGVMIAEASSRTIRETAEYLGQTVAVNDVELRARVQGYLLDRNFTEGDDITTGDVLFVIDPETYEATVAAAKGEVAQTKAALSQANDDLKRFEQLTASKAVSEQAVDQARTNKLQAEAAMASAEAKLVSAESDLRHTRIIAPIDGRIGRSIISVGNLIDGSTGPLARLVELDPMYVQFSVSDREMVTFKQRRKEAGQTPSDLSSIEVQLKLPNGSEFEEVGRLDFVDNVVDSRTGTVAIRARFPNPEKLLVPGLFVRIVAGREESVDKLMIPEQAVQEDQAGQFVMVVDVDNMVDIRRIKTGEQLSGFVVVAEGLQEGENVITEGIQKVRPGMTVNVSEAPVSQATEG